MIVVTKSNMPYQRKSTRSKPYRKRYTRRRPTVRSLARKVSKLSSNASRYIDCNFTLSTDTTPGQFCLQESIDVGDDYYNRDSNNTYTRKIYIDYMAQANDPEGNIGRFYVICVPDGTAPTAPTDVYTPISPMTSNTRQYTLMDYKFSMGAYQTQSSSGTSSNSYYPWHRIRKTIYVPKRLQKNWYQSQTNDAPTNSIWICFVSDSSLGNCPCLGYARVYFNA